MESKSQRQSSSYVPKILENPGDARIASVPIRNGALDARSSDGIGGGPDTLPRYNVSPGRSRLCFKRWLGNADLPISPGAIAPRTRPLQRENCD